MVARGPGTSEIFLPGLIRRAAASKQAAAAAMASAARPVTGAVGSAWMTMVWPAWAVKPSMWQPRSLQGNVRASVWSGFADLKQHCHEYAQGGC
jgi:hypothetical protein